MGNLKPAHASSVYNPETAPHNPHRAASAIIAATQDSLVDVLAMNDATVLVVESSADDDGQK